MSDIQQAMLEYVNKVEPAANPAPEAAPAEPEQREVAATPEPQAEQKQPEAAPEMPADIRRHKLVVKAEDGRDEEVEVDDNELKSGYMKERDYRIKTSQLAREREAIQTKIKEQVEPVVKQYADNLQFFEKALWKTLAPEMESVDWNTLAKENPAEWAAKMQAVNNVNGLLQAVKTEQQKLQQKQEDEVRATLQKQVNETVEALRRDIPGWNNDLYQSILQNGEKYGYSREELNAVADARAIKVLNDALQYRKLQEAKPAMEKKVVDVPKVMKPGTAEKANQSQDELKRRMERVRKTGRMEDAHAAAYALLFK